MERGQVFTFRGERYRVARWHAPTGAVSAWRLRPGGKRDRFLSTFTASDLERHGYQMED